MKKIKSNIDMINMNPSRAMLLFVLPMIAGNLFQQLYNMADSAIAGQFIGPQALSAIGASYAITNVFIASASGGSMGCAVVISQYFGSGDYKKMKTCISTALVSILSVSLILAAAGSALSSAVLGLIKTPPDVFDGALIYLKIYFYGLPFLFMYNALAAVFNALSDSRTPLVLLIFSSLLNIFLDLHFITKLNMGIAGAAWATLISQGVSAVISFTVLVLRVKKIKSEPFRYFSAPLLPVMGRIAVPSILQQSIVSVGSLMVQSVINSFGTLVLAGYTAATKIHFVLIVPVLALGNACATFTAQNIGAGKPERVRSGYIAGIKITAVIYSAVLVCVILFADSILGIFLKDPVAAKTIETGRGYLHFIAPFYYIFGLKALTDGVLKGSGDVTVFTLSNLVNLTIRVLAAFALSPFIGARAVWYAIPAGWCVNFIIGGLRYRSGKWKEKKVIH